MVSTVASETAFNTGGRMVNSNHCSLAPRMVKALVCTQNWLNSKSNNLELYYLEFEDNVNFEEGMCLSLLYFLFIFSSSFS